jgi:hypothetical protein
VQADGLMWWTNGTHVPALLATSPNGTPRSEAGVLGSDTTKIIFGESWIDNDLRAGVRLRVGYNFDDCGDYGLDTEFLTLGSAMEGDYETVYSTGSPIFARPFFNTALGQEDSQLVAFPQVVNGQLAVATSSDMYSAAAVLRGNYLTTDRWHFDLLGGYRYLQFYEDLRVEEQLVSTDPGGLVQVGTEINVVDDFHASNQFHGGEVGLNTTFEYGNWTFGLLGRVAVGTVQQKVRIHGSTTVTVPGDPSVYRDGGLLALPSNSGVVSDDALGVLPQLGANLQWALSDRVKLSCGYSILALTSVVRAGEQIDRSVDPSQLSPIMGGNSGPVVATSPANPFDRTVFWAQGLDLGLQITY